MGFLKCCGITVVLVGVLIGLMVNGMLTKWGVFAFAAKHVLPNAATGLAPALLYPEDFNFNYSNVPAESLKGQVSMVTGANIGLGYYTALHLAEKGSDVIAACRSMGKCKQAITEMEQRLSKVKGAGKISPMIVDLASLKSVQKFTDDVKGKFPQLNALVLNAGFVSVSREITEDGLESMFMVNHLSQFKIFLDLQDLLVESAKKLGKPSRVVVVSSASHYTAIPYKGVHLSVEDMNTAFFEPNMYYGQSKLCNVLLAQEIAARFPKTQILSNACHPGLVRTNFQEVAFDSIEALSEKYGVKPLVQAVFTSPFRKLMAEFAWNTEDGTLTQFYLAAADHGQSGKYYHPIARQITPSSYAQNVSLQKTLWTMSEQLLKERGFLLEVSK